MRPYSCYVVRPSGNKDSSCLATSAALLLRTAVAGAHGLPTGV